MVEIFSCIQKLLGHSNLDIVKEYVNMFGRDLTKDYTSLIRWIRWGLFGLLEKSGLENDSRRYGGNIKVFASF